MPELHVISALKLKRARLKGEISAKHVELNRLKDDLLKLDAVIRMFNADIDPETIPEKVTNKKNPLGLPKGTGSRDALDVLRQCGEPLTSQEIARRVLDRFGKEYDERALDLLTKTIHSTLYRMKGGVVRFDRETYPGKWELTKAD